MQSKVQLIYEVGDIVQIIDENHPWYPALLIVSEVKSWGVQADCLVPTDNTPGSHAGIAPNRLNNETIKYVGKAEITTRPPEDE